MTSSKMRVIPNRYATGSGETARVQHGGSFPAFRAFTSSSRFPSAGTGRRNALRHPRELTERILC